jgi:hypothetical protein
VSPCTAELQAAAERHAAEREEWGAALARVPGAERGADLADRVVVGPGKYGPPRYRSHFEPSFIELKGIP